VEHGPRSRARLQPVRGSLQPFQPPGQGRRGRWRALDLFYNYHEKVTPALDHDLEGALTRYWMGMSNIHPNPEKPFLDWVLLWPMIYRSEAELAELLVEGGFVSSNSLLVYEPFRIHGIAVVRK
jgi:hypothetical protein